MSILNYLGLGKRSASTAKDRLHIIIAQQRTEASTPDFLPLLREEIMAVIAKYVTVGKDDVQVDFQQKDHSSVLELNVTLPEPIQKQHNETAS